METLFDTEQLNKPHRGSAWQEALCGVYVTVDTRMSDPENYQGYIKHAAFGGIALSETLLSPQRISRNRTHLGRVDKDCYYLQILHSGSIGVNQFSKELVSNIALGTLFYATAPYQLHCKDRVRALYLEIPRAALAEKMDTENLPLTLPINTATGIGRVISDFSGTLCAEAGSFSPSEKEQLGDDLIAMIALAINGSQEDTEQEQQSFRSARLRAVKHYIEQNISNPFLSLSRIAKDLDVSIRYLHYLFEQEDLTITDWLWNRRLQICYEALLKAKPGETITEIAFTAGFSSSSHFSRAFKAKFGVQPRTILNGLKQEN